MRTAALCTVLAVLSAGLIALPQGRALDRAMVDRAHAWNQAYAPLGAFMDLGNRIGTTKAMLAWVLLPGVFGTEAVRGSARIAVVSGLTNQAVTSGLKYLTDRPRPDGDRNRRNSSFPSGHASGAAGLAWVFGRRHPRWAPLLAFAAVWIGSCRVFLERHFVSDVLAGWLVGIVFAVLAFRYEAQLAGWTWARKRR